MDLLKITTKKTQNDITSRYFTYDIPFASTVISLFCRQNIALARWRKGPEVTPPFNISPQSFLRSIQLLILSSTIRSYSQV
jgi:hypothetical protein